MVTIFFNPFESVWLAANFPGEEMKEMKANWRHGLRSSPQRMSDSGAYTSLDQTNPIFKG